MPRARKRETVKPVKQPEQDAHVPGTHRDGIKQITREERREKIKRWLPRGLKAGQMATMLEVDVSTITRDIQAVRQEMSDAIGHLTAKDMAEQILASSFARRLELWLLAQHPSPKVKLAALRELRATDQHDLDAMQALGIVYKAPIKVDVHQETFARLVALDPARLQEIRLASSMDEVKRMLNDAVGPEATQRMLAPGEVQGEGSVC